MRGHVRQRGAVWYVVLDLPRDPLAPKGRKQKWVRTDAKTKKAAEKECTRILRERDTGELLPTVRSTVGEVCAEWFEREAHRLSDSSRRSYEMMIRRHIAPSIGQVAVGTLTGKHVAMWLAKLRDETGLAPASTGVAFGILRSALKSARELGIIARDPLLGVSRPQIENGERAVWDEDQARTFLRLIAGHADETFYRVIVGVGLRRGEALALRWADLDVAGQTLNVRRNQQLRKGGPVATDRMKSKHSRRVVSVPPFVLAALRQHRAAQDADRERCGELWQENDLIFCKPNGETLSAATVHSRWKTLRVRLMRAGLPYCTIHDLRHLHATLALSAGVDHKTISKRLGHHSTVFTLDRYGHVTPRMRDAAAAAIESVLAPENPAAD